MWVTKGETNFDNLLWRGQTCNPILRSTLGISNSFYQTAVCNFLGSSRYSHSYFHGLLVINALNYSIHSYNKFHCILEKLDKSAPCKLKKSMNTSVLFWRLIFLLKYFFLPAKSIPRKFKSPIRCKADSKNYL